MNCMKCGRETKGKQVFCEECLADMEKYPVEPGTPVQIPARSGEQNYKPVSRRRKKSAEERLKRSKKTIGWLSGIIAVLVLVIVLGACSLAKMVQYRREQENMGKNYSTVAPSGESTGPTAVTGGK